MLGAVAGDMFSSSAKFIDRNEMVPPDISGARFSGGTILTIAAADAILNNTGIAAKLIEYYRLYPSESYGGAFRRWMGISAGFHQNEPDADAVMRSCPVGWAYDSLNDVYEQSALNARITNCSHIEIMNSQAIASSIYIARKGGTKKDILENLQDIFGSNLALSLEKDYVRNFKLTEAIRVFLTSLSFYDTMKNAANSGKEVLCMSLAIAEAYYGQIPEKILKSIFSSLDERLISVIVAFMSRHSFKLKDPTMAPAIDKVHYIPAW